jgi:hypothetical protein
MCVPSISTSYIFHCLSEMLVWIGHLYKESTWQILNYYNAAYYSWTSNHVSQAGVPNVISLTGLCICNLRREMCMRESLPSLDLIYRVRYTHAGRGMPVQSPSP